MMAIQKKLEKTASQIIFGLHLTCIKNNITHAIFVNAISNATKVFAPGNIQSRSTLATRYVRIVPTIRTAKTARYPGIPMCCSSAWSGCSE
jgi:hypothetical protein